MGDENHMFVARVQHLERSGEGVEPARVDLPGKCGEHQLRNQEVFYGKREQADAGISA